MKILLAIPLLAGCAATPAAFDRGPGYAPAYPAYAVAGAAAPSYAHETQAPMFHNVAAERGAAPLRQGEMAVCQ